jgi:dephospho-CoA kinase
VLNLKKVSVTGGIASGKSSLLAVFQKLGAFVVSADQIVHKLLSSNHAYVQKVIGLLGNEITTDGKIDRKKVAHIVFLAPHKLESLENLTHPLVRAELRRLYAHAKRRGGYSFFAAEVPLLFETENSSWYDVTIAVTADETLEQERFTRATGADRNEFLRRSSRLLPQEEKAKRAHFHLTNNGTLEEFQQQGQKLYSLLMANKEQS